MRVLLSTYGSRGDVEPLVALAVRLRELDAEVRVCAPPDQEFAQRLAGAGVPLVPIGPSARALTTGAPPPSSLPHRAAELIAGQLDTVVPAAEGCDVVVATGVVPAAAGALSVAEKLGIPSVSVTFQQLTLPSPHHSPLAYPGRPFPPEVTDNKVLWDLDAQSINVLFGAALNTNRRRSVWHRWTTYATMSSGTARGLRRTPYSTRGSAHRASRSYRPVHGSCPTRDRFRRT